jgi:antitoxin component HigA of HigAB toxin-antitoxin module
MSATLTVDRKKYARLANRITIKAIESEEEYDRMVAAVEQLMDKGEDRLSPEESALLETMAILIQAHDDRYHPLPPAPPNVLLRYLKESGGRTTKTCCRSLEREGGCLRCCAVSVPSAKTRLRNLPHSSTSQQICFRNTAQYSGTGSFRSTPAAFNPLKKSRVAVCSKLKSLGP